MLKRKNLIGLLCAGILIFHSCTRPSFYQKTYQFNKSISAGQFDEAEKMIAEHKDLEDGKNRFLYFVNGGLVEHLKGDFKLSNEYFERADLFIEDAKKKVLQEGAAFLLNPNLSTYYGEDHEVLYINYYKALNYYMLGENDEALVEARRLNLRLQKLSEKFKSERKFKSDAFMHVLMGMIYETNNEYNDAFIAYRNGYYIYESDYKNLFNLGSPLQLKKDLIRTAALSGLWTEKSQYEELFQLSYDGTEGDASVILLWNNGMGPVKEEWGINFAIVYIGNGWVQFVNEDYGFTFPFYVGDQDLKGLTWIKVAFPRYITRKLWFTGASAAYENQTYPLELAEDINAISFKILEERMLKEFSTSLLRVALKQVAANEIGKSADSPALGAALSIVASATESADTRNWQTIPHSLYYTRIPVNSGEQTIAFTLHGPKDETHQLKVDLRKGSTHLFPFYSLGAYDPGQVK